MKGVFSMGKEVKTNAMRILDRNKIPYEIINYECELKCATYKNMCGGK